MGSQPNLSSEELSRSRPEEEPVFRNAQRDSVNLLSIIKPSPEHGLEREALTRDEMEMVVHKLQLFREQCQRSLS